MIRCGYCSVEFEEATKNQRWCSRECRNKGATMARRGNLIIKLRLSKDDYVALERLAAECEVRLADLAAEMVRESMARCAA